MHIRLQNILTILFFGIVIIAAFSLVKPTLSYIEFFRAIERLDLSVNKFEPRIEGEEIVIDLTLILSNNAQYALEIHRVSFAISFKENEGYIRIAYPMYEFSGPPYKNLEPYSSVIIGPIKLKAENPGISPGQTVTWMITGEVLIDTFLGMMLLPLHPLTFNSSVT